MRAKHLQFSHLHTHNFFKSFVLFFTLFFGVGNTFVQAQEYNPAWCGGKPLEDVITHTATAPTVGECVFFSNLTGNVQANSGEVVVNGVSLTNWGGWWGSGYPAKADGGYYVWCKTANCINVINGTPGEPDYIPSDPAIRVSPVSILNLDYEPGTTTPPAVKITVTGYNLTGTDITVTAPSCFQVSPTSANAGFSASGGSVTLPLNGGAVWVRMEPGLPEDTECTGNVTVTNAAEAITGTVAVKGTVTYPSRDLYFQAGTNQNWGTPSNWRTTCGGGTVAASLPTRYDNVYICGGNVTGLFVVAQGTTAECKNLTLHNNNNNTTKLLRIDGSLTVYGNVDASKSTNAADHITVSSNAALDVRGNFDMGSQNTLARLTVNGTAAIHGNFTTNSVKRGAVAGNGLLQVGGNFRFGNKSANWNTPDLTLEMTGCGQTVTIDKNMTVGTFRQSATCTEKYIKAGSGTITTTIYDQNCNPVNLRNGASGFAGGTGVNLLNADCDIPQITVSGSIPAMSACVNTFGAAQSFTVSAQDLTDELIIGPVSGYLFSKTNTDASWYSSLTYTAPTVAETTVYVRLNQTATATAYPGTTIPVTSTGAAAQSVAIGKGTISEASIISPLHVTFEPVCSGDTFGRKAFTIRGECLTGSITLAPQTGYIVYDTPTGGTAQYSVPAATLNAGATYYLSRLPGATFSNQDAVDILTGSTKLATITAGGETNLNLTGSTTGTLDFAPVCPGENFNNLQPFTVQGGCIAIGGVSVSAQAGFEIYENSEGTATTGFPATNFTVSRADATAGKIYYLKRTALTAFNGTAITLTTGTGADAVTQIIRAAGVVKTPTLTASSTLEALSYPLGEGPDEHSFIIAAECLTHNITLALSGSDADKFEITANSNFDSLSTVLPKEGGLVYVRFKEGYENSGYKAAITATSGVQTTTIDLTGDVVVTPRNFYYSGTGNWNDAGNWYKSCGNTTAGNQWNAVPNAYDNVELCNYAEVTVTSEITRFGTFTMSKGSEPWLGNHQPAILNIGTSDMSGQLNFPNGVTINAGVINIFETAALNVAGDFTLVRQTQNPDIAKPVIINNKGVIEVIDGKFEMKGAGDRTWTDRAAYFNNEGRFNLINSDFAINGGTGVFFYNENSGIIYVDNPVESNKTVSINNVLVGVDANCTQSMTYYCNGTSNVRSASGKACNKLELHMQDQLANNNQMDEGAYGRVFFNEGSKFLVKNSDMALITSGSSQTNTIGGEIFVQDGNLEMRSSQGGFRMRLKEKAGLHVYSIADLTKGKLLTDGGGGGAQIWVEGHLFARGFEGANSGGCNALNMESGSHGFIGDMAASVTDQFKIHVLDSSTLYYCGNKIHGVGDEIGYVFAGGKLHYANDFYEGLGDAEKTPITIIDNHQDFNLKPGATADDILKIEWETTEACQAAFDNTIQNRIQGNDGDLLPVELVEFTGKVEPSAVVLHWKTMTETENDYFIVQRLGNNNSFNAIGTVDGAGTTSEPHYYSYYDYHPLIGISYYRLMQTDFNGVSSYSPILPIVFNTTDPHFEVFTYIQQNVTHFNVHFSQTEGANIITIHTLSGMLVYNSKVPAGVPTYSIKLMLSPGIYLISNVCKGVKQTVKVQVH